jgi:hypothetical protein
MKAVLISAAIVGLITPFGLLGGWWLARMSDRTSSLWPILVAIAAAFVIAVGIASIVARLDPS